MTRSVRVLTLILGFVALLPSVSLAQAPKPNIVVIMGDDVGMWNLSAYHRGMMGGSTPNIDRIAKEGALFKNHLRDRNEFLPTVHGFDEFYGILYHLNAMEEPYQADYPKDSRFHGMFGPRNIVDAKATTTDDPATDPRWGRVGKQTIADGGPLPPHPNMDPKAKTNMEDVDEVLVHRSLDFIDRSVKAGKPFFLWHNATRTHVWTHLSPKWKDKSGYGLYADAIMELDNHVGSLLKKLDDLGIADNTIVIFTSDNGAEIFSWPDGGNHPFRGEKGTTFEGGFRVPMVVKWPGTIKPGTVVNDIFASEDWMPTLLAAAGDPEVKEKLLKGMQVGDKTFKNHLDGYNLQRRPHRRAL